MIIDYFKIPLKEIRRRKLRSWLTLIGIFIGIAAIISLITLGQGLENAIEKQFEALGKDKLIITAKGGSVPGFSSQSIPITKNDLEVVRKTSGVKKVAGMIYSSGGVEFNNLVRYVFISGMPVDPEERALIGESQSYKVSEGRLIRKGDKYKAVLGYAYSTSDMYDKRVEIGDKVLIGGEKFKVIGFLEKIGSPPDDQSVMIPIDTYYEVFGNKDTYGLIIAQTQPGKDPLSVAEDVNKKLRQHRGLSVGEEDLTIETADQLAESFTTILSMVQIVLIGIAAISLLVGGIGIMNTMYTAVLERTKEIGVMKALGARNSQVMWLFLVESGLYGFGGGFVGVLMGISLAKLVEYVFVLILGPAFLSVEINYWLILVTLLFSFLVGCLSGIAPARSASKQRPVDSLRYE